MAGFLFNEGADSLLDGTINWASDTIRARPVLTSAEAAVNKDATVMTSIGVTGYDVTLGSKTRTKDDTTDRIVFDAADFAFVAVLGAVGEVNHFIVFKFVTNDAASIPIAKVAMTAITPNGGDINVTVSASGLFYTQQ
jgi:hypothetical protein